MESMCVNVRSRNRMDVGGGGSGGEEERCVRGEKGVRGDGDFQAP